MFKHLPALAALVLTCAAQTLYAQERTCSTMDVLQQEILENPARMEALQAIEDQTNLVLQSAERSSGSVITIPVVVHVVYNTSSENISDAQILSQINVLNQDFRRTNPDADGVWPQAADTEIQFCLATVDPSGNPTTGITRTSTSATSFSTANNMKFNSSGGKDAWPASSYLNIWVCDLSSGLLGYAQFPGGSASTDGVVCDYLYFGTIGTATAPFNKGRTTTHEVGHWLNLRHIWGDGGCTVDDFVSDTPLSDAPNYGCTIGHVSCSSTDMVQNYMDYSDDACMNLFTAGQTARMRALFSAGGARASLLSSAGCGSAPPPPPPPPSCTLNPLTLSITFDNYPSETSWSLLNDAGATVATGGPYGSQPAGSTLNIPLCVPNDCYTLTVNDSYGDGICCAYGSGSYTLTGPSGTLASGGSFTFSQSTNFCLGSTPAPTCSDGIQNGTETGVDCGGSCPPCPTGCVFTTINSNNFESGLGIWLLGSNARRSSADAAYANGTFCVRLRSRGTGSVMSTSNINLAAYNRVRFSFSFITRDFTSTTDDFFLQVSTNGGSTYSTVVTWRVGTDFSNLIRYNPSVTLVGTFTSNTRFRIRSDASNNRDHVYVDDVLIEACNGTLRDDGEAGEYVVEIGDEPAEIELFGSRMDLYPNPANQMVNIAFDTPSDADWQVIITDLTGKIMASETSFRQAGQHMLLVPTADWAPGIYLVHLSDGVQRLTGRISVVH
jgi:hypothetical protein